MSLSNMSSQPTPHLVNRPCSTFPTFSAHLSPVYEYEGWIEPDLCTCTLGKKHHCWEVDFDVYGVIHSNDVGCATCNKFASHIHHSRRQRVRGIEEAYAKMHERHDILWRRGLKEGARRHSFEATPDNQQLLKDLDVAQIKQAKAEEELKHLTQVVLGKISLVDFLSTFTHPTFAAREEFWSCLSGASAGASKGLWNDEFIEDLVLAREPDVSNPTVFKLLPLKGKTHTNSKVSIDSDLSSSRSATPQQSSYTAESSSSRDSPANRPGEDIPGYYNGNSRASDIRGTLITLFNAAHAGDSHALDKCKALCREAHVVDALERTYGMRYVLIHWKKPHTNMNINSSSNASPLPSRSSRRGGRNRHKNSHGNGAAGMSLDVGVALANPKITDPPEVWFHYLKAHNCSWPNGVRKQSNGDPWMADLRASRMFARLRPAQDKTQPIRNHFTVAMLSLFTNRGRYRTLVRQLSLRVPSVANYVPFCPSDGAEIVSEEDIARHFASCGVTVKEVENEVEGWAIQYKRERDDKTDAKLERESRSFQ